MKISFPVSGTGKIRDDTADEHARRIAQCITG